jgi:hypothetical protein
MDRGSNSTPFRWIPVWCVLLGLPAPAAVPVDAYGNLPSIEQVALSPMKRAGRPAEFITLDKEDHYLSRSATRLQMLQSSITFLPKHNPSD